MAGHKLLYNLSILGRRHSYPAIFQSNTARVKYYSSERTDLTKVTHTGQVSILVREVAGSCVCLIEIFYDYANLFCTFPSIHAF